MLYHSYLYFLKVNNDFYYILSSSLHFVIIKINDFQTTGIRISTEALASLSPHGAKISPTNVRDFHDLWFCFV